MAKNDNAKPERIIWYRGGASEGSLQAILKNEMQGNILLSENKIFFELSETSAKKIFRL
jgi:hypothetical protein